MGNRISCSITRLLGTVILMFILVGCLFTYRSFASIDTWKEFTSSSIKQVRELEWQFIEAIIYENYDKADLVANGVKDNIEKDILREYPDGSILKIDLAYPSSNAKVYQIFTNQIRGKYLNNIKNDNNDLFIATSKGIATDLSLNCSTSTDDRSWETEKLKHANIILADKAIEAMLKQTDKPKFWQYRPGPNLKHPPITEMEIEQLHQVFLIDGVRGLEPYEFLKPVYIRENEDIFGTSDVNNMGVKQNNYKLIVVQGFNIVDILNVRYKTELLMYDANIELINETYKNKTSEIKFYAMCMVLILLFCIICTAILNNNYVVMLHGKGNDD